MRQQVPGSLGDLINAAREVADSYHGASHALVTRRAALTKHAEEHPADAPIVAAVLATIPDPDGGKP